jgi:exodeoxyribonuclease-3
VKIATYNINGINGRLPVLVRWLEEAQPDAVCLQELKAPDEKFPLKAIEAAGYGAVWEGQSRWNGVAILAKDADPIVTRRALPGGDGDNHARYIEAAVSGVLLASIYAPNGNPALGEKFSFKLAWLSRLITHAADLLQTGAPVVLAGDFNIIPADIDVYAPERWRDDALFRPEVRQAFRELLEQGWTDGIRQLRPGQQVFTFWDYFRNAWGRNAGLRLDHFLLSPSIFQRLVNGGVDREVRGWPHTSDHAPTWIEIADA